MPQRRIRELLISLARNQVKFATADDICNSLGIELDECLRILSEFEQQGLVRLTKTKRGESYCWLKPVLAEE